MSRPQRIEFPGAYYHVMNRGRHRENVFEDDACFDGFLSILSDTSSRFGLVVHAYCLMNNHYHLLVSTPEGNLQRAMRHVGGVYTQFYNRHTGKDGALFRGRYKAILVDSDEYLLHLSKYIHRNPIEAAMVEELSAYRWSSYPAYIGKRRAESWLYCDEVYNQLTQKSTKKRRYKAYVEEAGHIEDINRFYSKNRLSPVLGDKAFIDSVVQHKSDSSEVPRRDRITARPSIDQIVRAVASEFDVELENIRTTKRGRGAKNEPRKVAMYLCAVKGGYTLTAIADYFGLSHYGSVSSPIHQVKEQLAENGRMSRKLNTIINRLDP